MILGGHWSVQMGGAQFQAKGIVEALHRSGGFDVHYLARKVPGELQQADHRIVPFGGRQAPGALLRQLPSLYSTLVRLRPHLVYQRCLMPYTGAAALYCRRHRVPFVFHIASDEDVHRPRRGLSTAADVWRWLARSTAEYGLRRASAIIAQTEDQARSLAREYGLPATVIVHNFHADAGRLSDVGSRPSLRVLWIGNFKSIKRPELFVDVAEGLLSKVDAELVMIGRPGNAGEYAGLFDRMRRLPNLTYLGELDVEEVERQLERADLLVTTSRAEGFPNTFIQGWLRGVPALSLGIDPDGCLSRGGAGVLVGSVADLIAQIADLDRRRDRLRELAAAARRYGVLNHTGAEGAKLVRLFRQLARTDAATSGST
jgi:glycosyltransferase involved in cell wall biosynthesis